MQVASCSLSCRLNGSIVPYQLQFYLGFMKLVSRHMYNWNKCMTQMRSWKFLKHSCLSHCNLLVCGLHSIMTKQNPSDMLENVKATIRILVNSYASPVTFQKHDASCTRPYPCQGLYLMLLTRQVPCNSTTFLLLCCFHRPFWPKSTDSHSLTQKRLLSS